MNKQSVFVIDSKGTEEQQVEVEQSLNPLSIIHEDEQEILKDLEIDSLIYGNGGDFDDNDIEMKSNEDLTIKLSKNPTFSIQKFVILKLLILKEIQQRKEHQYY